MRFAALMLAAALATAAGPGGQPAAGAPAPPIDLFFAAAGSDERKARPALDEIARGWRDSYAAMIIDLARLMRAAPRDAGSDQPPDLTVDDATDFAGSRGGDTLDRAAVPIRRESLARRRLISFLERQTKQARAAGRPAGVLNESLRSRCRAASATRRTTPNSPR